MGILSTIKTQESIRDEGNAGRARTRGFTGMPILNYSTTVDVQKTIGEIHTCLAKRKVQAMMQEYDINGVPTAMSFRIMTPFGMMCYRLPANIDKVLKVLERQKGVPYRLATKQQAARVAWRIVKVWIEAQCAFIESEMVTLDQVFLPYAQDQEGKTVY
jgi:hypothetical protein